jgi:hypothetical protein
MYTKSDHDALNAHCNQPGLECFAPSALIGFLLQLASKGRGVEPHHGVPSGG